jgi:hypothetical protein
MATNSWLSMLVAGLAANLPATPEQPGLSLYYETDTGVVDLWTGSAWVVLVTLPLAAYAGGVTASATHTLVGATPVSGGYVNIATCAGAGDCVSLPKSRVWARRCSCPTPAPRLGPCSPARAPRRSTAARPARA